MTVIIGTTCGWYESEEPRPRRHRVLPRPINRKDIDTSEPIKTESKAEIKKEEATRENSQEIKTEDNGQIPDISEERFQELIQNKNVPDNIHPKTVRHIDTSKTQQTPQIERALIEKPITVGRNVFEAEELDLSRIKTIKDKGEPRSGKMSEPRSGHSTGTIYYSLCSTPISAASGKKSLDPRIREEIESGMSYATEYLTPVDSPNIYTVD